MHVLQNRIISDRAAGIVDAAPSKFSQEAIQTANC